MNEKINEKLSAIGENFSIIMLYITAPLILLLLILSFNKWLWPSLKKLWPFLKKICVHKKEENTSSNFTELNNILNGLSKNNNKKSYNKRSFIKLSKMDDEVILKGLKKRKLVELFYMKANIEDFLNSSKVVDDDLIKYFGFLIVFFSGIISSAYAGLYSGITSNLISGQILEKELFKLDYESRENELGGVFKNVSEIITVDSVFNSLFNFVFVVFIIIVLIRFFQDVGVKLNAKNLVLLELVNYAIEFNKEREKGKENELLTKNKNNLETEVIEVTKITENKARKETLTIKQKIKKIPTKKIPMKKKQILKKKSPIKKQKVLKKNSKLIK